jgi:hypothetical protein
MDGSTVCTGLNSDRRGIRDLRRDGESEDAGIFLVEVSLELHTIIQEELRGHQGLELECASREKTGNTDVKRAPLSQVLMIHCAGIFTIRLALPITSQGVLRVLFSL